MRCPKNKMCFNLRGSATCIDTPCPPSYERAEGGLVCLNVIQLFKVILFPNIRKNYFLV